MQNHYNLVYREEERDTFPTLKGQFGRLVALKPRLTDVSIYSPSGWDPSHGSRSVEAY
jgi:hypothetical protein